MLKWPYIFIRATGLSDKNHSCSTVNLNQDIYCRLQIAGDAEKRKMDVGRILDSDPWSAILHS